MRTLRGLCGVFGDSAKTHTRGETLPKNGGSAWESKYAASLQHPKRRSRLATMSRTSPIRFSRSYPLRPTESRWSWQNCGKGICPGFSSRNGFGPLYFWGSARRSKIALSSELGTADSHAAASARPAERTYTERSTKKREGVRTLPSPTSTRWASTVQPVLGGRRGRGGGRIWRNTRERLERFLKARRVRLGGSAVDQQRFPRIE